jgi:alcohol dehydrogenase class IV
MPDANYSVVGSAGNTDNSINAYPAIPTALTTTTARIGVATTGGTGSDRTQVCVAVFR